MFFLELSEQYDAFKSEKENSTVFTEYTSNEVQLSPKRPGFIVSSTSWTEDEDFSILLNALQGISRCYIIKLIKYVAPESSEASFLKY